METGTGNCVLFVIKIMLVNGFMSPETLRNAKLEALEFEYK